MVNSTPHLLNEDRYDFEQLLDEALRETPHHPDTATVGQRLTPEQLRTMALSATTAISAAAATEYQNYVRTRWELRQAALCAPRRGAQAPSADSMPKGTRLSRRIGGAIAGIGSRGPGTSRSRPRLLPLSRRLLAAILGVRIRLSETQQPGAAARSAWTGAGAEEEVHRARQAWRLALLEHGIRPFLREALADPNLEPRSFTTPPASTGGIARLGYSHSGLSSPVRGAVGPTHSNVNDAGQDHD